MMFDSWSHFYREQDKIEKLFGKYAAHMFKDRCIQRVASNLHVPLDLAKLLLCHQCHDHEQPQTCVYMGGKMYIVSHSTRSKLTVHVENSQKNHT